MAKLVHNTLQEILQNSVSVYGDKIAYALGDTYKVTYTQLGEKTSELGYYLHTNGLVKGDKVVIIGENMPQWGISYFGVTNAGCVMVPVLVDFSPKEMLTVIQHSEAKALIVSNKVWTKLSEVDLPDFLIISMNDFTNIRTGESIQDYCANNKESFLDFNPEKTKEEDLACIIYTSGTTGRSKGVMLSNDNLVWNAIACLDLCPINDSYIYLSVLPLAHTYECTLGLILGTMQGTTTHYIDKAPTANVLMPLLKKIRPTIMLTVPLIIEKIFKVGVKPKFVKTPLIRFLYGIRPIQIILHKIAGKKLKKVFGGRLTFFGIGGAAVSSEIERFLRDAKFPYSCGYGLTETSPMICGLSVEKTKFRSVGPAMKGIEYKLIDINKETGEGEFVVRGRNVMMGYFKDPQSTKSVLSEDGWFKTGDLGVVDKYGNLTLKGRSKNMILGASGENIYPEEIESIINEMDAVVESVVYQYKGKLVAQVYLNKEEFSKKYHELLSSALNYQEELMKKMEHYLKELKIKVNSSVAKHSQLSDIELRHEPFEKTATMKIKRFLLNKDKK